MPDNLIFSFDIGTGSLGECVRRGEKIEHLDSLLMPAELASTKEARDRRHLIRTRLAHHKRENWWRQCAEKAGIEVLETRQPIYEKKTGKLIEHKPDPRMLREFPEKGDGTIYTSCLLRIALLQGQKLESWQIFKAVWSSFQHRGYDPDVPWANKKGRKTAEEDKPTEEISAKEKKEADDEKANRKASEAFVRYFTDNNIPEQYISPCYYEAHRLGLWDPRQARAFKLRIEKPTTEPARNSGEEKRMPAREMVSKEITALLEQARKQYPKLPPTEYIMYGEAGKAYPSYNCETVLVKGKKLPAQAITGHEIEAQGVLGQKVPRFENRIISKCCLIPRLNVCKAKEQLNKEVQFLRALQNLRYKDSNSHDKALNVDQVKNLFEQFIPRLLPPAGKSAPKETITAKMWHTWVDKNLPGCKVHPAHTDVKAPKLGERSRLCRPALRLVKELILSGKDPKPFYAEKVAACKNTDEHKGLIKNDHKFLQDMGDSWYKIHIPDNRREEASLAQSEKAREQKIAETIGEVNNPVVRHRLNFLLSRLRCLKNKCKSVPDKVVLEFVRSDFMGEIAKRDYDIQMKRNQMEKDEAHKAAFALGLTGDGLTKMRLYREQGGMDFYDFSNTPKLTPEDVADCEIDHIVPRSKGGPDALYNKVLTRAEHNKNKKDRTPFEWIGEDKEKWRMFCERISACNALERKKKKRSLLTASDYKELLDKYTHLAETAYTAKLAQKIICLYFGWPQGTKGSTQKIVVSDGAQTAAIRRRYKLDRLLHKEMTDDDFIKLARQTTQFDKKNRGNPRHHALDALVISMQPELKYDPASDEDKLPKWFTPDLCKTALETVTPHSVAFEKPKLAETIYGVHLAKRDENGKPSEYVAVTTAKTSNTKPTRVEDWASLSVKEAGKRSEKIYSPDIRADFERKLSENPSQEEWKTFITGYRCANGTRPKKIAYIESRDIAPASNGKAPDTFGEFRNAQMPGQYIKDKKEHKGQLVCQDEKGKWEVVPVYVWESLWKKSQEMRKKYKRVEFFHSQQLVEVQKSCNVPAGIYKLNSIMISGQVLLTGMDGTTVPTKPGIGHLIDAGNIHSAQKKSGKI